jgi:general secretion pathway protein J
MNRQPQRGIRASRGFTLVEVLVALMIVAMGLAALMVAVSGTARTSGYLRDKTLAQWMALNRLSEVRLNLSQFGQNTDTGELNFANRTWHYDTRSFDTSIGQREPAGRIDWVSWQGAGHARQLQRRGLDDGQHAGFRRNDRRRRGGWRRAGQRHYDDHLSKQLRHSHRTGARSDTDALSGAHLKPMSIRRHKPSPGRLAGFTLIEVLVALLILGIMSALGYGTYRAARISAERTEEALKRSREIEFGMRMLVQDFAEAAPRPVRDILGESRLPALQGTGGVGTLSATTGSASSLGANSSMSFASQSFSSQGFGSSSGLAGNTNSSVASLVAMTRGGWSNTAGQQRSTLQRVSYGMVDDTLKRSYQTSLDTVQGNTPVVQDLLTGVKAVQLRYLDGNQTWQTQWPPPTVPQSEGLTIRPVAVEIIIEFKDWGRIRRLIEVAG